MKRRPPRPTRPDSLLPYTTLCRSSERAAIKAAMFLTTDNATAHAKLLLGPDKCLRVEPVGDDGTIEMDDYDRALSALPKLADRDFATSREGVTRFFAEIEIGRAHV